LKRYDGTIESLASRSRRLHHHPNEHFPEEIKLIRRYWDKNKDLGLIELWFKVRNAGYKRHYVSLYRVMQSMQREGLRKTKKSKKTKVVSKAYILVNACRSMSNLFPRSASRTKKGKAIINIWLLMNTAV